jgi:hypothetical protein
VLRRVRSSSYLQEKLPRDLHHWWKEMQGTKVDALSKLVSSIKENNTLLNNNLRVTSRLAEVNMAKIKKLKEDKGTH